MNHGVGVLYTGTVGPGVLTHEVHQFIVVTAIGPVVLVEQPILRLKKRYQR